MQKECASPINGRVVVMDERVSPGYSFVFRHEQDGFADFIGIESLVMQLMSPGGTYPEHTAAETRAALDLVRSYLWRARALGLKPLLVTTRKAQAQILAEAEVKGLLNGFQYKPFEEFLIESERLTFEDRADQTLLNIGDETTKTGMPVKVVYASISTDGWRSDGSVAHFSYNYRPDVRPMMENGLAYGSDGEVAAKLFEYLESEDYITPTPRRNPQGVGLTAKGHKKADELRRAKHQSVSEAFFIRRWAPGFDTFFTNVFDDVAEKTGVRIKAVWDEKHNEKIDARILRKIEAASIVVIDLSSRFNVGFEAGYAYKCGKTLIMIREKPSPKAKASSKALPFDVITHPTFDWEVDKPEALIEDLVARINLALGR